ncbi:hypothetical protein DUI87_21744 [Hirundo rustica rustica]|uniref:Uncharacterized protein n=1 Tax=Hirundo rustica rustica TaxID=333673 RepID=A0A3M0JKV9_HIRRU|nr:hypothetical protein DUI87_21744 [Hirundo rustica rustica]
MATPKPVKSTLLKTEKITPKENGSTYGVSLTGDIPEPFGHNPVPCALPEKGGWTSSFQALEGHNRVTLKSLISRLNNPNSLSFSSREMCRTSSRSLPYEALKRQKGTKCPHLGNEKSTQSWQTLHQCLTQAGLEPGFLNLTPVNETSELV